MASTTCCITAVRFDLQLEFEHEGVPALYEGAEKALATLSLSARLPRQSDAAYVPWRKVPGGFLYGGAGTGNVAREAHISSETVESCVIRPVFLRMNQMVKL